MTNDEFEREYDMPTITGGTEEEIEAARDARRECCLHVLDFIRDDAKCMSDELRLRASADTSDDERLVQISARYDIDDIIEQVERELEASYLCKVRDLGSGVLRSERPRGWRGGTGVYSVDPGDFFFVAFRRRCEELVATA